MVSKQKTFDLSKKQKMERLSRAMAPGGPLEHLSRERSKLPPGDRKRIDDILTEFSTEFKSPSYEAFYVIDYEEQPVGPKVFLEDKKYIGSRASVFHDNWKQELCEVLDPSKGYFEWIITGSIGSGKTTVATAANLYKLHRLLCMRDPHAYFEIPPGSRFVFGLFNLTLDKSDQTLYYKAYDMLASSEWFRYKFEEMRDKENDKRRRNASSGVIFPKQIRLLAGSQVLHALSEDIYSCVLDEMNFRKGSNTSYDEMSKAFDLYQNVVRRIESRYGSNAPGILCNISSKKTSLDFLEKHIDKQRSNPRVRITCFPLWRVKPKSRYPSGEWFRVACGTGSVAPRILEKNEPDPVGQKVIQVPEEHHKAFVDDIYGALRDIAGESSAPTNPLIHDPAIIYKCRDNSRFHPFRHVTVEIGERGGPHIHECFDADKLLINCGERYEPRVNPAAARYIHVDLGLSKDAAGFAMGHSYKRIPTKVIVEDEWVVENLPLIYFDILLEIRNLPNDKIDFSKIRYFIHYLKSKGFRIGGISTDGWQSVDFLQIMKKFQYECRLVSIDRDDTCYNYLVSALSDGRESHYAYDPFEEELKYLETKYGSNPNKRIIDHRKDRKKDVCDAAAGVARWLYEDEAGVMTIDINETVASVETSETVKDLWVVGGDINKDGILSRKVTSIGNIQT